MTTAPTITRDDIVREARALIGVPFKHQHSDPNTGGLDCRGLLEWVAYRLTGRPLPDVRNYRREPDGKEFYEKLKGELDEVALEDAREADVVMMKFPRDDEAKHAGILTRGPGVGGPDSEGELMLVHAFEREQPGKVIEEPYRRWPQKCAVTAFRFRGIAD
jgi:cell wall-associated NlpC family hydrolase